MTLQGNPNEFLQKTIESATNLVEHHVVSPILWYQKNKKTPRRLHRITTAMIVAGGASIPLVVAFDSQAARLVASAIGVMVAILSMLNTTYQWSARWHKFTDAQSSLEAALAEWQVQTQKSITNNSEPHDRVQEIWSVTHQTITRSYAIQKKEEGDFFQSVTQSNSATPSP